MDSIKVLGNIGVGIPEKGVADSCDTPPQNTPTPFGQITPDECLRNFKNFIKSEKKGLDIFYKGAVLEERANDAARMVNKLRGMGCGKETSKQLAILCLYDIVMLIDDSSSMSDEDGGERIKTLKATMEEITKVYDLAKPMGLLSVKFINSRKGYKNIDQPRVGHVIKDQTFWGTTRIGSALQKKVIDNFVFKRAMEKPLLVMVITDGEPEGEPPGYLKTVINECVKELEGDITRGKDAVAFHFSRVGNDEGAARLLHDLSESCRNVACLRADYILERLQDERSRWDVLPRLLLGAIIRNIKDDDYQREEPAGYMEEGPIAMAIGAEKRPQSTPPSRQSNFGKPPLTAFYTTSAGLNNAQGEGQEDHFQTAVTSIQELSGPRHDLAAQVYRTASAATTPGARRNPHDSSDQVKTWHPLPATAKADRSDWKAQVEHYKLQSVVEEKCVTHTFPRPEKWINGCLLGRGSQGQVTKQENEVTKEVRAVKTLFKFLNPRFNEQEIKAFSMVQPDDVHFVKFLGWYENTWVACIAMEYMKFGDLKQYIENGVAKAHAPAITRQILEALAILHGKGICHRDVKPQNVLVASLDPIMLVKITDFGGSKNEVGTKLETGIYTRGYMPPEMHYTNLQGECLKAYTNKVDIFSLGCMVHEILTQEVPFARSSSTDSETISGIGIKGLVLTADESIVSSFVRGEIALPMGPIEKSNLEESARAFLTALLALEPESRPSALQALTYTWVSVVGDLEP